MGPVLRDRVAMNVGTKRLFRTGAKIHSPGGRGACAVIISTCFSLRANRHAVG